ncbi:hypothetical protein CDCA_CDCA08G2396 [Cyanidium caldarium]|uniref:DNA-directed DNA polymerase family A palm domain-containing protein n=1 Tax=Cyanidium caldarium TaxID=2771 RepID=A0AAV9IW86_CYACA|nr:hypothetical protein CDCA_CDCA08G2396 [Cyanidium caldarium]
MRSLSAVKRQVRSGNLYRWSQAGTLLRQTRNALAGRCRRHARSVANDAGGARRRAHRLAAPLDAVWADGRETPGDRRCCDQDTRRWQALARQVEGDAPLSEAPPPEPVASGAAAAQLERDPPAGITIVRSRTAARRVLNILWRLQRESERWQRAGGMASAPDSVNGHDNAFMGSTSHPPNDCTARGDAVLGSSAPLPWSAMFHAWDTETVDVDPAEESPIGHGRVICLSAYCGPDVDFGNGPRLWIDNSGDAEGIVDEFAGYFGDEVRTKVWHNYSFDRAMLGNHGIGVRGFAADTMHMARLWDASRRRYSLEALSDDLLARKKRSLKERFGRPRILKSGTAGKEIVVPAPDALQASLDTVRDWVDYSTFDAEATWFLRDALEKRLRRMHLRGPSRTMYDLYRECFVPFGELLTEMEQVGFKVDIERLVSSQRVAQADRQRFADAFRAWAAKHSPDAALMNVESENQKRQLLFAPSKNRRSGEALPPEDDFQVENTDGIVQPGSSKPKKKLSIVLKGMGMPPLAYTASGWPACNTAVLRKLAGEPREQPPRYGTAYDFFSRTRGADADSAAEACRALDALVEANAVGTLLDTFIEPLQALPDANRRIHASLNLNTETGRLSARRPNLQNQPALEKDRYRVRQAFTCEPGNMLVVADYGQLELRLLAHISKCRSMLEAFEAGGDFHSRTACGMYPHVAEAVVRGEVLLERGTAAAGAACKPLLKEVFSTERRRAKTVNFSIAYGKTPAGLARDWGTTLREARATVGAWYRDRPEVREWQQRAVQFARKHGYVKTLLGRRRPLPDIYASSSTAVKHAERAAINTPLQGSAADVVMKAMLRIRADARLAQLGWRMILQVHDEIILEGPADSVLEVEERVTQLMKHPFQQPLLVALSVSVAHARTWYEAK